MITNFVTAASEEQIRKLYKLDNSIVLERLVNGLKLSDSQLIASILDSLVIMLQHDCKTPDQDVFAYLDDLDC